MAYIRKNKLLHMQKVINTYLEYKSDGVTTAWVYRNHIYPIYHISISTLYFYLRTPVKKLIKEDTAAKPAHQIAPMIGLR